MCEALTLLSKGLLPLPEKINSRMVINEIATEKDVDGLGSLSVGRLAAADYPFIILVITAFCPFLKDVNPKYFCKCFSIKTPPGNNPSPIMREYQL